jgi:hypothetical protein
VISVNKSLAVLALGLVVSALASPCAVKVSRASRLFLIKLRWRPCAPPAMPPAWLSSAGRTRESVRPLPETNDTRQCPVSLQKPSSFVFGSNCSFVPGTEFI